MTKLDAGIITPFPASDSGSAAVWGSKSINPRPQFCLCLTWSGYPLNDDDDDDNTTHLQLIIMNNCWLRNSDIHFFIWSSLFKFPADSSSEASESMFNTAHSSILFVWCVKNNLTGFNFFFNYLIHFLSLRMF